MATGIRPGPVHPVPDFNAFAAANPWMGAKVGPLQTLPNGGYEQDFQAANVYGQVAGQPFEVHGPILKKYLANGGPTGFLGYPTTSQTAAADGQGQFNHFEHGSIYFHPNFTEAFEVHGLIHAKWASLGWEKFGYPITDETGTPDGVGRFNHFRTFFTFGTADSSIYFTPQTNAHEVHGDIRTAWANQGWETGALGYPVTDEYDSDGGRRSDFQNGSIFWTAAGGAQVQLQYITIDAPSITFGSGIAVGGYGRLVAFSDGTIHFTGHLHASGFPSYDCLAVFTWKDSSSQAYVASHSGRVHGSDEPGSPDLDWDDWGLNDQIRQNWARIRAGGGSKGYQVNVTSDWSPQKIAEDAAAVAGVILSLIPLILGGGSSNKSSDPGYNTDTNQQQVYPPL